MGDLNWLSIKEANSGLKKKDFSSEDLVKACLRQLEETDKKLNNFVTVTEELALERARAVDKKIAQGEEIGVLEGVPAGIKDILNTREVRTTCSSKMLENFVPPYESTATARLLENGYVLLGKTNLDEFACGVSTERSAFGTSLNPWNTDCVAGGSSGGSTSAVAAGQIFYSLGTDTGGSIRLPASFCGCVGLKVTYGRVSRFGVTSMASSWDTIGPIARSVEDAAIVLNAIAGHDPYDATTPKIEVPDYTKNLSYDVKGLRIGIPDEYFSDGVDEEVKEKVMEAIKEFEKMGASLKKISLPLTKYGVAVYYVTMPGELSTNLARFDGVRFGYKPEGEMSDLIDYYKKVRGEGFGDEIKRRIMVGTFVLSAGYADAYYKQAQRVRTLFIREFQDAFKDVDVIMAPSAPSPAMKVGEKVNDPLAMYLLDVLTIPASTAGLPAISIPCGFSSDGLPIGLQIIGPQWAETEVLKAASAYEQATDWNKMRPKLG
ncbi:Asp-tRNA(Asn)/Glu-tRNA(Gln) amidotransferase subunit GatA [Patescibacteria group bacterium]|nr:Asp-tRNA(Asn)/Glu-tRNA(Gln) amidotransferase subunit GatA [Patescibacteria group bacterium]